MNSCCWVNIDESAWQPAAGDEICSLHFASGEKNDNPTHPGYTLNMPGEGLTAMANTAEQSVIRVERWTAGEERKCRQFEKKKRHMSPASLSLEESLLSILILVATAGPSGSFQPSWLAMPAFLDTPDSLMDSRGMV